MNPAAFLSSATGVGRLSQQPTRQAPAVPSSAPETGKRGVTAASSPRSRWRTATRCHFDPAEEVAIVAALGLVVGAVLAWVHPCLVAYVGAIVLVGLWRAVRG
jgi:hypothetical protein